MKRFVSLILILGLVMVSGIVLAKDNAMFKVYTDANSPDNHYIPSGWMGDYSDISMDDKHMDSPNSGSTCIKVIYTAKRSQGQGWAGVYWQNPPNNWGSNKGGFDLTGMTKLSVWMKGAKGGEIIDKIMIGGIKGTYPDSAEVSSGPIQLTDTWKQYTISLVGKDISYISGGFGWVANADSNPNGATFYIDDIKFESDPSVQPETRKVEDMPFYVYEDKGAISNHFIPSGWMGDYADMKIDVGSLEDPYAGATCIKIEYNNKVSQGARWAGIYWQNPANNWGGIDAGYNLFKATKLTFWARGEKGGERIEEFKMGGIMGEYPDSDSAGIGPVILTKEWKQYTIDLTGKDLTYIVGGFCWSTNIDVNPNGIVFYLDDIKYE
ncbi:MAG: hypothetical protein PHS93_07515 [Candidatus Omnitrophica bacterium]|nr:hypothetical protein [Candidatus Omnitrophota bacterium]MDD5352988.1 hypothetical protein [Candidatus Omnitrophota bacterium]MDD5550587.1 hypothetical protein [Candidatus Omnitrophota bacterium]